MKAAEQDSPAVLSIVLSNVVLTFAYVDKILKINVTIQMKATEPYFSVVRWSIMLCNVVLSLRLWMKS